MCLPNVTPPSRPGSGKVSRVRKREKPEEDVLALSTSARVATPRRLSVYNETDQRIQVSDQRARSSPPGRGGAPIAKGPDRFRDQIWRLDPPKARLHPSKFLLFHSTRPRALKGGTPSAQLAPFARRERPINTAPAPSRPLCAFGASPNENRLRGRQGLGSAF